MKMFVFLYEKFQLCSANSCIKGNERNGQTFSLLILKWLLLIDTQKKCLKSVNLNVGKNKSTVFVAVLKYSCVGQ